jgi:hypothetical protein
MSDDIRNNTLNSKISFVVATIDLQLPVCLSGMGVLNYIDAGVRKRALCLLAIIPEAGQAKIMYGTADMHMRALQSCFSDQSSPAVIEMLESWMCHGSDHWFMTPSEWRVISESRKQATLDLILNSELSIADPVEFSILDTARKRIIGFIEESLAAGTVPDHDVSMVKALLEREKKSSQTLPFRTEQV